jgi:hypothetical protein
MSKYEDPLEDDHERDTYRRPFDSRRERNLRAVSEARRALELGSRVVDRPR